MHKFVIGVDFGTESARSVLVDLNAGGVVATSKHYYSEGVIDKNLPGSTVSLGPDWALQDPADWLNALGKAVQGVLRTSEVDPSAVVGIGLDFTSCTIVPTTATGTPLCFLDHYGDEPHAWAKLWKHHAAQPQADRINDLAMARGEKWLGRYGGKLSSEWLMPKALQMLEEAPHVYIGAERIVEGGDWMVWELTGELVRNACAAGYKATWHKRTGYPSADFLRGLHPGLEDLYTRKLIGPIMVPGTRVGFLTESWGDKLGLSGRVAVATPIIDAHSAVLGSGITEPGFLFMMMGTSTCHMLMAEEEMIVEGIAGVVEDGICPGMFGYEAGQAGVGDIFAWFVDSCLPPNYHAEADRQDISLHEVLSRKASSGRPGESGLLALDWWNGNRSTLVDADLSGLLIGCTLATRPEEIYRALVEATAYGTRAIVEAFAAQGISVSHVMAAGGLTENKMLMQIYADVLDHRIEVSGAPEASALGAAMLGSVAAGAAAGGFDSLREAILALSPPPVASFQPTSEHRANYELLYREYRRLYDYFGRGENELMKTLRQLRKSYSSLSA